LKELLKKSKLINNIYLDEKFHLFYKSIIEPIRHRFNQGLLYNLNSKITNFDRLNTPGADYDIAESPNKEVDISQPCIPLNEIIKCNMTEFMHMINNEVINIIIIIGC
jgi:hypothetical protein